MDVNKPVMSWYLCMNIIHHKGYQAPFDQFNVSMNEEQISVISSHNIYQLHGIESFQNRHSVDGLEGWLQT